MTTTMQTPTTRRSRIFVRVSSILAAIGVLLAVLAGIGAAISLPAATPSTLMVETWRMIGFFTFAAIFALLAARPLLSPTLWIIVIANKLTLTIAGLAFGADVEGALTAAAWDGALVLILSAAFASAMIAKGRTHRPQR